MNYAIRPATPTPIICRKDAQGHMVVYLLDTLHPEDGGTIEKWTVGDRLNTSRVSLSDYHVSKGLSDMDEQIVADRFVESWGARNGIAVRRRLYKQSPHHLAQQRSADTSMVPIPNKEPATESLSDQPIIGTDKRIENASKEQALKGFSEALKTAQLMYTQTEVDQKIAYMKQDLADKLIVALTRTLLDVLWKNN